MIIQSIPYPPAAAGGPFGAHRYWRAYFSANNGHGSVTSLSGLQFRDALGSNLTGSGTPISGGSGADSGSFPLSNLFDGNSGTVWERSATATCWAGYDFGSAVSVADMVLECISGGYTSAPQSFSLEYSDDNVSWTTADSWNFPYWAISQQRAFPTGLATGEAFAWRVYIPTTNSGTLTVCTDLQWRTSLGGSDASPVCTSNNMGASGRVIGSVITLGGNEGFQAYDSTLTGYGWAANAAPQWIGFAFPSAQAIAQIAYMISTDTTRWLPTEIRIEYWDDSAGAWQTSATYSGLTWSASEQKLLAA